MSVLGWSTTAMASRYTHVITVTWPAASTASCGPGPTNRDQLRPHLRPQPKAGAQVVTRAAFGLVRLAVAAGFEPAEGCPSRAFEFCGWWFRPVRLGLVAPVLRLGSPPRTHLNLRE
jgi:hypothetical protein